MGDLEDIAGSSLAQVRALGNRITELEAHLGSVVASLHALAGLLADQGRLALGEHLVTVRQLIASGLAAAAGLVPPLTGLRADDQAKACDDLIALRSMLVRFEDSSVERADRPSVEPPSVELVETGVSTSATSEVSTGSTSEVSTRSTSEVSTRSTTEPVRRELRRLRRDPALPARLHGCLLVLAFSDAELDPDELAGAAAAHLAPGADADRVAGFLLGLLQAAPDLLLHTPELVAALNAALAAMEAEAFLAVLPDLRRAFTWLKPSETSRLARQLAELTGARASDLDAVLSIDPAVAEQAAALERELTGSLVRDGLAAWLAS